MIIIIEKYLQEEKVNGIKKITLESRRSILKRANQYKSLSDWDKEVFNQYILNIQKTSKVSTVEITKSVLRKYFNWCGKSGIVAHVKVKMPKSNLRRDDILSVEDINKLIENTDSPMYKALISFLFESGGRINEVLSVKVRDVQETDRGMIISLPSTKTGNDYRRSLYVFSAGYIRNHLTYSGLGKDDRLFSVKHAAVFDMLQKIETRAKTGKHVNPHSFRHARATDLVLRGVQESIVRKHLGWVGDSKMISTYQHIIDDDVIDAMASMNGFSTPRKPVGIIKPAEPIKIIDSALQLSQVMEESRLIKETMKSDEEIIFKVSKENQELREEILKLHERMAEILEELHS
ncbi:MAG TPA: tyrosine-type recombinase/integrase [Candidatus Methylomirabilis sp.]|nr:tyrosine-type recombinase/integrase [Candidatus Methylomirabilis sp.]